MWTVDPSNIQVYATSKKNQSSIIIFITCIYALKGNKYVQF